MSAELRLAVDNDLPAISRLCAACTEFMEQRGVSAAGIYAVNLALEEMVTNIVKYGYDDLERHAIQVSLRVEGAMATLVLEDDGHAFNPLDVPAPDVRQSLQERPIGGLGIHLTRKMAASMEYRRDGGRNILTIHVRANPAPAAAGGVHV